MIVMKFGGTSVGTAESIRKTIDIVKSAQKKNPFVVVSALSGVTDLLLSSAKKALERDASVSEIVSSVAKVHASVITELGLHQSLVADELSELEHVLFGISLVRELTPRTSDRVASLGERMSSKIVAAHGVRAGLNTKAFNAYDLGMITDRNFCNAEILASTNSKIVAAVEKIQKGVIPIVTGFIGQTEDGDITTLGRGGSDYSGAIFGAALNAEEIQIWTDVDGILTADPRIVQGSRSIEVVSFEEASELAYFGAKVLHPKTIIPAMVQGIPVRVLNTFNPLGKGTLILKDVKPKTDITAITSKSNINVISINSARMLLAYGFMYNVFKLFDEYKIPVDLIATSEVNVSLTVEKRFDIKPLVEKLKQFASVKVLSDRASISIVGTGIKSSPGVGGTVSSILGTRGINIEMTSQGYDDVNQSIVIKEDRLVEAVKALHDAFFPDEPRALKSKK
jgi:aspartate kinase